ncbi:hypothetical protein [Spirosoma spitsbergense]|uniref:hypothetical protein n=1 Tax=Spirosoma spitsbergense TaxID=431554 RepID=UPI0003627857|nr:hypothetical protein [Spirosoma spitsbergense]
MTTDFDNLITVSFGNDGKSLIQNNPFASQACILKKCCKKYKKGKRCKKCPD